MSIPVICDRCRSTGAAGEADFSHLGDLLEFEPVPRRERVDGWSPDKQRAFIAALSATGSKRRAALSIGMQPYGVDQLLKAEGSDSFKAAVERALAIAKQHGAMKLAQGVADVAARTGLWERAGGRQVGQARLTPPSRLRGLPADDEPDEDLDISEDEKLRLMEHLAGKFMKKVAAERQARLDGQIVAADFYLRQITMLEVLFDLAASSFGWDADDTLRELRRGGHSPVEIVSTPFSDFLDERRRAWWLSEGDPERPPHPDPRFVELHTGPWGPGGAEGYSLAIDQHATGALTPPARGYTAEEWRQMNSAEQLAARQKQFDEDAEEQREWERRAFEAWAIAEQKRAIEQQSGASVEEPLSTRPGCGRAAADSFDVTNSLRDDALQRFRRDK